MKVMLIIGWIFLVSSFFGNYNTYTICTVIAFSAHYIIEAIKELDNSSNKIVKI